MDMPFDLKQLTPAEKDTLLQTQWERIQLLETHIKALKRTTEKKQQQQ